MAAVLGRQSLFPGAVLLVGEALTPPPGPTPCRIASRSLQGVTDYIDADLREPDKIVQAAAETRDFTSPSR
jgi:hypothetical protein